MKHPHHPDVLSRSTITQENTDKRLEFLLEACMLLRFIPPACFAGAAALLKVRAIQLACSRLVVGRCRSNKV